MDIQFVWSHPCRPPACAAPHVEVMVEVLDNGTLHLCSTSHFQCATKSQAPCLSLEEEGDQHYYSHLQAEELRCRKVKWFAQAHTTSQCQISD